VNLFFAQACVDYILAKGEKIVRRVPEQDPAVLSYFEKLIFCAVIELCIFEFQLPSRKALENATIAPHIKYCVKFI